MSVFARLRQRRSRQQQQQQRQQPMSTAPMARNTENPRFSRMAARKRSINLQIRPISWGFACLSLHQFRRLPRKLGLDVLLPNSAYKMCGVRGWIPGFPPFQRPETRKQGFSMMAAGTGSIHRQIRRFFVDLQFRRLQRKIAARLSVTKFC